MLLLTSLVELSRFSCTYQGPGLSMLTVFCSLFSNMEFSCWDHIWKPARRAARRHGVKGIAL